MKYCWKWNFVRGTGIYLYEMRFGEMMGDDDDVMKCVWEWNFVRGRGVCVHVGRFVWGLVWCRDVLCFLYNWNFMWWTTNYLYEMGFVRIVVWCRDATQFSLQFKFHLMNDQLSLWNEVRMDSCVRVVMYCECFVFSIIQISCDEPPTISMKWGLERWWVMSWCHSDVSTIQISCDEWPTISMKWS